ncbi:D-2-hydroxyacid dehydrogenase [Halalkalibacter okhensis]|uniref:D-2-hydroxyacid dehydrogenase n=1 Tax=Halalkalibacter okhensis TaxID=333138 RepID=A0A0B0IHH6_9BACI|nr:D-2-hydroxyacid dehydrogenase [Halalkalibacter okhensis]KHF39509.1 hypothetical protein LQ50_14710 [Halalkalibacter okhensis]
MIVSTTDELTEEHLQEFYKKNGEQIVSYFNIEEIDTEVSKKVEILITFGNDLTAENLDRFPRLRWIQLLSVGLEDLPFEAIKQRQIFVTYVRGIHAIPMTEFVIGGMLHFAKHFHRYIELQKQQVWDRDNLVGELNEGQLLIYGTGAIGSELARKAKLFNMTVHGVNSLGKQVAPFDEVFTMEQSFNRIGDYDYVAIILPLTPTTKGIFSEDVLIQLNKDAVLINVGRGGLMDEDALYNILNEKKIKGAILDVFIEEPLPKGHPFWELENVVVTPHMSAKSGRYIDRCMEIFNQNYTEFMTQERFNMINVVNLDRYY